MDELRVALIGYGTAGATFHAPVIAAVPGLRVTAVVTRDPARAAQARTRIPGVRVLEDAEQLWARAGEVDTVVVATPNRTHLPLALAAVEAGLPVLVDKPLAVTSVAAQRLVDRASERGVLLSTYQNRRWDSDWLTLRRAVDTGELGIVQRLESRFERWRPAVAAGWRSSGDPADGGGVLTDLGSHLVDQAVQLLGPVVEVYAEVAALRPASPVDDDAFLALTHVGGARSHLWVSVLTALRGPRLRVLGSAGGFVAPELDPQEAALRAGGSPADDRWGMPPEDAWAAVGVDGDSRRVPPVAGAYQALYAAWGAAVRGLRPVPVDPADAVTVLRVLEAARTSAQECRVVGLLPA